ncbi:hypothetical protein Z517_06820 [Fonsecaea pedrosoi CBS 271.37]|uniref:Enoyl reductase (ER) domain-containing protein n=1 Tax=Fonsecaea pedrosoi CBS 271.37 TaxID=1442368 RepID=A0A0D2GNQ3_9EURO|nr:uncharacterized protein Z517_06820 [Fonsecaea pedrosoi CBS 271.37]KIW80205.1 hypothetical protein Z517_06820 [Fonsecaea pedrosoi CBS 271.37]
MAISDLPQSMKAIVFQQANERLAVTEKPLPELAPGDLLVKVVAASLCASDIVPWRGFLGDPKGIVPGHEGVGIVVKGADYICKRGWFDATDSSVRNLVEEPVRGFKVGDRVGFVNAIRTCGSCAACLAGHGQCCENGKKNQGFHLDGFFAQYTVVDWQFAVKIHDGLPLEKLSPLFCAGITAYGAVKKVDAPGRGYLGVFGLGGVGTLVVRFAVALGYTVIGFDVSPTARSSASNYGATEVVDPSDLQSTKQAVEKITNGKGLDGAVVAVGSQAAYEGALETIGFGKTLVTVGVPHGPIQFNLLPMIQKMVVVKGTQTGCPLELREMLDVVQRHRIIPEVEISDLEAVPDLFAKLVEGKTTTKLGVRMD